MKIALIYVENNLNYQRREAPCHLGISYVASYLKRYGDDNIALYDCPNMQMNMQQLQEKLTKVSYDAIGLSVYHENFLQVIRIATYVKAIRKDTFIFAGGYLPTLVSSRMKHSLDVFDCLVIGEGELITLNLIKNLKDGNWKKTLGISYISEGKWIDTGPGAGIDDLDQLPFPIRIKNANRNIHMLTARGCKGHCIYCSVQSFLQKSNCQSLRRRSPENVVAEIKQIVNNIDAECITFCDDNFPLSGEENSKWFDTFYQLIKKEKISVGFNCQMRADEVEYSLDNLKKFGEIGLSKIFIGIDSLVQKHLDYYNKQLSVASNIQALKLLEEFDFTIAIGFMLFNPIIKLEDILETIACIRDNRLNKNKIIYNSLISSSYVVAYPGTPIAKIVKNNHCYAANLRKYYILDAKCELCFQIMSQWNSKVQELVALAYDNHDKSLKNQRLMSDLFYMDLELLELVVKSIDNGEIQSVADCNYLLNEWVRRFKHAVCNNI